MALPGLPSLNSAGHAGTSHAAPAAQLALQRRLPVNSPSPPRLARPELVARQHWDQAWPAGMASGFAHRHSLDLAGLRRRGSWRDGGGPRPRDWPVDDLASRIGLRALPALGGPRARAAMASFYAALAGETGAS